MIVIASIASDFATAVGVLAGMIAVSGFLAQVRPTLSGDPEKEIRRATVTGGVGGFIVGALVIVLSAITSKVTA
ncbi:MAG TPA: hypothetical protein VHU86_03715 [Solirubrobacterales bacterium]|jgi:hypothetical protein|nr:hypothetical protein [Solirubrobacterales bacterium]